MHCSILGLSWWPQLVKNPPAMWRPGFDPWVGKIPGKSKWQPTQVGLPGQSHGPRSLVGYSPQVAKSQTRLRDFTFTLFQISRSIKNAIFLKSVKKCLLLLPRNMPHFLVVPVEIWLVSVSGHLHPSTF